MPLAPFRDRDNQSQAVVASEGHVVVNTYQRDGWESFYFYIAGYSVVR